jgi:hypothetical protein
MAYDPRTLENFERLLEHGESFVFVSDWTFMTQYWVDAIDIGKMRIPGHYKDVINYCTLGLTEGGMYFAQFKDVKKGFLRGSAGFMEVVFHWYRPYQNFITHQFNKNKTNKGELVGYTFIFSGNDGVQNGEVSTTDNAEAEKFKEVFMAGVGRFKTIAASPDFAQQLSAMAQLHQEGVLSDAEFQKAKELFLGKPKDAQQQVERSLRSLKQLKDTGVLTEAEYATKKWDLLAKDN